MPKSRHRKNQKQKAQLRTNKLKSDLKKYQEAQKEQYMKLLEEAQTQREANQQKESTPLKDLSIQSTNIPIDSSKGGDVSGISYK